MMTCEICGAATEYRDDMITHREWHRKLRAAFEKLEARLDLVDGAGSPDRYVSDEL